MRLLIATFRGADYSGGYRTGQRYLLRPDGLTVRCTDGSGYTPYGSLAAFVRNWSDVDVVDSVDGRCLNSSHDPHPARWPACVFPPQETTP